MARYGKRFAKLLKRAKQSPQYWVSKITLDFANTLAAMLKAKGMSKKALAERIGASPAYVTKVLRGDANYTVETMVKLAMAVDARVEVRLLPRESGAWHSQKTAFTVPRVHQLVPCAGYLDASNEGEWQTVKLVHG